MNYGKLLVVLLCLALSTVLLTSCAEPDAEKVLTSTPVQTSQPADGLSDAEKQAAEYERIAREALDNEHEHVWVFSGYQERHPHSAEYTCECGAIRTVGHETAYYTLTIVGKSPEHPHYMVEECSICHEHFPNENIPSELTWIISGYTKEHPHYAVLQCTLCEVTKTEKGITSQSMGESRLITEESTSEHPHYMIVMCTYPGCDHKYIEKNATEEWELVTDSQNYSIKHPHHLFGSCSHEGCLYTELMEETADWEWKDGVCSICGTARNVMYTKDSAAARITGLLDEGFEGKLRIPSLIEGLPVESIEPGSFSDNDRITIVDIPDSAIIIGSRAFSGCVNLTVGESTKCPIKEGIMELSEGNDPKTPVYFPDDFGQGHLPGLMGSNVSVIESEAFRDCISLVSICFGEKLIEIQTRAFEGCAELRHVFFLSMNAPMLAQDAFINASPELRIYVPAGSSGYDAAEWEQYRIIFCEMN